jgi:hypothetical protein
MKPFLISKKNKKQFLELDYLYAELDYYEEGLKEAQNEFQEAFFDYSKRNNLGYNQPQKPANSLSTDISTFFEKEDEDNFYERYETPQEEQQQTESEPEEKDEDLYKLYKKIASLTHPDVIPLSEKEELKQKRIQQFIEAQEAYKQKNWYKLCQIAISLGLEVPEPKKQHLKWMESEGVRIRNRIEHIKSTFAWVWYNEEDNKKDLVMRNYFRAIDPKK